MVRQFDERRVGERRRNLPGPIGRRDRIEGTGKDERRDRARYRLVVLLTGSVDIEDFADVIEVIGSKRIGQRGAERGRYRAKPAIVDAVVKRELLATPGRVIEPNGEVEAFRVTAAHIAGHQLVKAPEACDLMWKGETDTKVSRAYQDYLDRYVNKADDEGQEENKPPKWFSSLILTMNGFEALYQDAVKELDELTDDQLEEWNKAVDQLLTVLPNCKLERKDEAA